MKDQVFALSPWAIWLVDSAGRVVDMNPAARRLIPENIERFSEVEEILARLDQTAGTPEPVGEYIGYVKVPAMLPDGSPGSIIYAAAGAGRRNPQDVSCDFEDPAPAEYINPRAAHEMRNFVSEIRATCQLGQKESDLVFKDEMFSRIIKSADELNSFIERVLGDVTGKEARFRRVNLNKIVDETLWLVGSRLTAGNVQLVKMLDGDLPAVSGDEHMIRQALINLIRNAFEAMPRGGILEVRTWASRNNKTVILRIKDTGSGISRENLRKIFSPAFSTKGEKGKGLGLSITRRIIKNVHKGRIWFHSTEGRGTSFYIELPQYRPDMEGPCQDPSHFGIYMLNQLSERWRLRR